MTHYLKEVYGTHGIKQEDLAKYLGMTQAYVSLMLNGKNSP